MLNMESSELFDFLEEIPDDNNSNQGDISDNDSVEEELLLISNNDANDKIFDIESLPIIFSSERSSPNNDDVSNLQWESEDEIPLSVIRAQEIAKKTIWSKSTSNCLKNVKIFDEISVGPKVDLDVETPINMFLHIFPDSLCDHIVFQTNLYALQKAGGNANAFTPTNLQEIKRFLSINLMMGVKKMPSYRDYWSSRSELRDPFISSLMPRDRFSWLLGHVHLNDNSLEPNRESPNYDKLYKLRPFLDKLSETFMNSFEPSQNQAIDESMIRFKGRSYLKQYMPNKPIKRGYKVWIRADKSGYACQFQIYVGKVGQLSEKNLGCRVVEDLTRTLVGKGHRVYFDNFFNSIDLQKKLLSDMIYACGTVRKGRKNLPVDFVDDKQLKRGACDWRVSLDGLVCLKWMDNRPVYFLSNYLDPSKMETVNRKQKDGNIQQIACPELVKKYNDEMGHVDKMDMLKSLYEVDRKSKKWWHRIFFYFLDLSVVNAFILFKQRTDSNAQLNLKQFRMSVAMGLVGGDMAISKKGRPSSGSLNHFKQTVPYEIRYDSCSHMPIHIEKCRRCAFCSTKAEPHKSRWLCTR